MGLYKLCKHSGRARDRCEHPWWGCSRGVRKSLQKWTGREIPTKTEAYRALDELRAVVRSGANAKRRTREEPKTAPMTFEDLADSYKNRHVLAKKLAVSSTIGYRLRPLIERFGSHAIDRIRTADIEDFIADLRNVKSRRKLPLSPASINRTVELLRHMFNWAVGREYLEKTPFRRGTETLIQPELEDNVRRRRMTDDEEGRLLAAASPLLRSMIVTALDTGLRRGEMLALRWSDVDLNRGLLTLRGSTTKSGRTRHVPISTARLRAVLEWLRLDVEEREKPTEQLVFTNEVGEPVGAFRTAWVLTVLRAHGATPAWQKDRGGRTLTAESHARFRKVDLRWHDLRHEYASRLVEQGIPLAQVRDLLGHASITTTERYDNQTLESLQAAAKRLERGATFDATTPRVSPSVCQQSVKIAADATPQPPSELIHASASNSLEEQQLSDWLGGRDSNPDNVVQSHVSYR